ncbi:capsule assembly Wzi family protein [Dokdonia sp. Hel_I_53]|uniref:capsule assembly Wzi family protein n=1 Tax=Dokdonia sp. Hel_I_53 TaxID=1566287 RepID=UPI0011995396|nr:capsule assembly Wzi family protein [Dokdonia sp. Hel_I_53]TVZ51358.1 capsule assembly protein Wzi [Dokdonia sp. Hel_I_53]
MRGLFFIFFLSTCFIVNAQEKLQISSAFQARSFLTHKSLPYWSYVNTNDFLDENSQVGVSAFAKAKHTFFTSDTLEIGLGGFIRDGLASNIQRSDLYVEYKQKWFTLTAGAKSKDYSKQNLSTINDNILVTGNARAIPGIVLKTTKPVNIVSKLDVLGAIGHYRLNDERNTRKTNVHYKRIGFGWNFRKNSRLQIGLRHYVQWGGITSEGVALPNDFTAFKEVFIGQSGTGIDNPNENINALGNHLGSYEIKYSLKKEKYNFEIYHQTLFEDRSGRELNNFPDGVWGIFVTPKKSCFFKGILYEYAQTISQSGSPRQTVGLSQQSGGDNYFSNTIYTSGWTYEGKVIGLPFIVPSSTDPYPNNRIIAHHIGVTNNIGKIISTLKFTYLQNLGTYYIPYPEREKKILSYLELQYPTKKYGTLNGYLGADISNINANAAAIGVGYSYRIN